MRLDCARVEEAIWDFARDGTELSEDVLSHIGQCDSCAQALAEASTGLAALDSIKPYPQAPDCTRRVVAAITRPDPAPRPLRFAWVGFTAVFAAALAVVLYTGNITDGPRQASTNRPAVTEAQKEPARIHTVKGSAPAPVRRVVQATAKRPTAPRQAAVRVALAPRAEDERDTARPIEQGSPVVRDQRLAKLPDVPDAQAGPQAGNTATSAAPQVNPAFGSSVGKQLANVPPSATVAEANAPVVPPGSKNDDYAFAPLGMAGGIAADKGSTSLHAAPPPSEAQLFRAEATKSPASPQATEPVWPDGLSALQNNTLRVHADYAGQTQRAYYSGDTSAFNSFLKAYSKVKARPLKLVLHSTNTMSNQIQLGSNQTNYDWMLSYPAQVSGADQSQTAVPTLEVWVGGNVDRARMKVPSNIRTISANDKGLSAPPSLGRDR